MSTAPYVADPSPAAPQQPAVADRTGRRVVAQFRPYRGRVLLIAAAIIGRPRSGSSSRS